MPIIDIVVMDLVGIDKSRFIYDLNYKLVKHPAKSAQEKSSQNPINRNLDSMPVHWWTNAQINNIGHEVDLIFYLAPILTEGKTLENEVLIDVFTNSAKGYIFVVDNKDSTWNTNRDIIQQWQTNLPLPSVILVQDKEIGEIDILHLRKVLGLDEHIEIFAYKKGLASELKNVVLGICYAILDVLEARLNQKNISDTDTSSSSNP